MYVSKSARDYYFAYSNLHNRNYVQYWTSEGRDHLRNEDLVEESIDQTKTLVYHFVFTLFQSAPGSKLPVIGGKTQNEASEKARTAQKAGKVKVLAGMTPSCNRKPVGEEPRLSINDTRERRNEIYRIYAQRFDDIAMHKRHKIRQLFMSQIEDRG